MGKIGSLTIATLVGAILIGTAGWISFLAPLVGGIIAGKLSEDARQGLLSGFLAGSLGFVIHALIFFVATHATAGGAVLAMQYISLATIGGWVGGTTIIPKKMHNLESKIARSVYFLAIMIAVLFLLDNLSALATKLLLPALSSSGQVTDLTLLNYVYTVALSLTFLLSVLVYLRYVDKSRKGILERLGLSRSSLTLSNVLFGLFLFLMIFLLEIIVSLISNVTNIQINTNVNQLFAGAPVWFFVFSAIVAPIDEETLFRGLMVPRIGIFASAVFFALPHITYGSTFYIEVIAAFVFGVLAGYVFKRTGSLYPSIIAHILINTLTLVSTFSFFI